MVTTSKGMFLWHLQKYHSEDSSWLYRGLNVKASILCHEKVRSLIHKEFCGGQGRCSNCPEGYVFSATSDAWTTNNNINYTTCSVHFIDRSAWILHHFALRILKITVFSNADGIIQCCQSIWQTVDLDYKYCSVYSHCDRYRCNRV